MIREFPYKIDGVTWFQDCRTIEEITQWFEYCVQNDMSPGSAQKELEDIRTNPEKWKERFKLWAKWEAQRQAEQATCPQCGQGLKNINQHNHEHSR